MEGINDKESFEKQFTRLEEFWGLLQERGYEMMELSIIRESLESKRPVPVIHDGLNGLRASITQGVISIWFTNSFEDPNNLHRKEIEAIWAEVNSH